MAFLDQFFVLSPYLVSALLSALVALVLLREHRGVPGRTDLGGMLVAGALWSLFTLLDDASTNLPTKLVFTNLEYMVSGAACVFFFRFALFYSIEPPHRWLVAFGRGATPWILPLTVALLVWMDESWGFVRRDLALVPSGDAFVMGKTPTVLYWAYLFYLYGLTLLGIGLWGRSLVRSRVKEPWSAMASLVITTIPLAANVFVLAGANPWPGHDPTPAAFTLLGLALAFSIGYHRFLTPLPAARELVMDSWPDPLLTFDALGRLTYFNEPASRAWGMSRKELGLKRGEEGSPLEWLLPCPLPGKATKSTVTEAGRGVSWEVEERPLLVRGKFRGTVVTCHDVSAFEVRVTERTTALEDAYYRLSDELQHRRRTEQQLFYYSLHDSLTGLANRSLFLSRLGQSVERLRRDPKATFGLLVVNFTDFKKINDQLGHSGGDEFLSQAAQRLSKGIRSIDTAARSTADRFLILLDSVTSPELLREAAERIRADLEAPLVAGGVSLLPSVRVGMLWGNEPSETPENLLADVEIALKRSTPTNAYLLFDPRWRQDQRDRDHLKDELGKALVRGDLHLVYQPIVSLGTGGIVGYEALTRWNHPARGPIPPDLFIPLAEQEGTIRPLGLWVLREAARFFRDLARSSPAASGLFVSVNVSPLQLGESDFATILLSLLEREGLPPSQLHLEITETAFVQNSDTLLPILETLREKGIRIKLDDFGTGYSSLHALHRFPIDTLKIDRSFVLELPQGGAIVRTIIALATELGLDVVAEGVETAEQERQLRELACQAGQGYLYSPGQTMEQVKKTWQRPQSAAKLDAPR